MRDGSPCKSRQRPDNHQRRLQTPLWHRRRPPHPRRFPLSSTLGEDKWSWTSANIPSALSQAEVDARSAREREEKAAEEAEEKKRREQEAEKLRKADAEKYEQGKEKKFGVGRTLVQKPALTAEERRMEDARGMTDEMRMKLERERRARAAEERIRKMQGK
jgi:putative cell wall-binding protein